MTGALVAAVVALAAVLAAVVWRRRARRRAANQVDAFAAARAVTNRWSTDPTSTPQPLREFLHEQGGRTPAASEAGEEGDDAERQ
ncbi:MAG: hypothetical protein WCD35_02495 [Mycobacteriales bacterium]